MESAAERFARMLHLASKRTPDNAAFAPPIVNTSIYALPPDPSGAYQYARWGNPTWTALEEALGVLEDAEAVTFPSGMAAIAAVFYATLKPGDRVLLPADGYYTTRICADRYLVPMGIGVDTVATARLDERAVDGFRLVMIETPDLVVGADTKALNGHSDVLFGHVTSRNAELMAAVRDWRRIVGAIPGPFESWLVHRGLETLEVRWARMCASAQTLAERLAAHPAVRTVSYPGLPGHPQHALARRQMTSGGALIGLTLADKAAAERFIAACPLLRPATSFGGVHSSAERRARWGDQVAEGFLRVSIGCEPTEVLWQAVERALAA